MSKEIYPQSVEHLAYSMAKKYKDQDLTSYLDNSKAPLPTWWTPRAVS